jgi:hypothetical protein
MFCLENDIEDEYEGDGLVPDIFAAAHDARRSGAVGRLRIDAARTPALAVHVHLTSGRAIRFVQPDAAAARDLTGRVHPQRLFGQPLLLLTGAAGGLTAFPTGAVEQVDLLTDDAPAWTHPDDVLDVVELSPEASARGRARRERPADLYAEFEMRSGRPVHLRVSFAPSSDDTGRGRVLSADRNLAFTHVFQRAVIWGRREEGGLFLLNPANVARLTAFPPDSVAPPPAALPAGYFVG